VDAREHALTAWRAFECHRTQVPNLVTGQPFSEAMLCDLLGLQPFYRAYSTVNGGRAVETDLFEGLR